MSVTTNGQSYPKKVAVMGGGAFGTGMAQLMARKGCKVMLQVREAEAREGINNDHENTLFLPGVKLEPSITAVDGVPEAVKDAEMIFLVIPTQFLRKFIQTFHSCLPVGVPMVCCAKGIENDTLQTPFEIMEEELPGKYHRHLGVLTGPSFAREVAEGQQTNVTVAARDPEIAKKVQYAVSDECFRAYTSSDVIGCEICGAIKNVYAIASGALEGFGMGYNARAALITRGLAEISRLAVQKGASPLTISGLAGVGDLTLTCTGTLSRNWQLGNRMAKGETLQQITESMRAVAEGVHTAKSLHQLMETMGIHMPIADEIYKVLFEGKGMKEALAALRSRPLREEVDPSVIEAAKQLPSTGVQKTGSGAFY
ncbi:unnamed protein product [Vitrella brassicaformis CCMP3155]|uniref:Glycerol-3-phosphate dehydrogenase [NAD(+)] n=2 Tax=Vitrella brassicaformis TaxID=1169539 RepID=A0A0G4GNP8_VITBC|nr:unnamed protein product [Vitrella brassicaformis CCMP3155]|eukprot:CEM31911.1 unnamed protein product [Vitrella brassicaformis CCMP3155]